MVSAAEKAKMSMLAGMDEEALDDQYLEELDDELAFQGEQAKQRSASKGRLWLMQMPEKANGPGGTRVATGRILLPLQHGLKVVCHDKWSQGGDDNFNIACPGELVLPDGSKLPCELCKRICKKKNITRDQLVQSARTLAEYAPKKEFGFRTQFVHCHYFWYNEDRKGDGGVRILFGALNDQSPMGGVHNLNLTRFVNAKKNPQTIETYDIQITQSGEGMHKSFKVIDIEHFEFDHWVELAEAVQHPLDKRHLRWDFVLARTWDKDLIVKYKAMAYEALGDEVYKPDEDEEDEAAVKPKKTSRSVNGRAQAVADDEEKQEPRSPLEEDDIEIE